VTFESVVTQVRIRQPYTVRSAQRLIVTRRRDRNLLVPNVHHPIDSWSVRMTDQDQINTYVNGNVIDSDGDKVGSVGQVYVDDQTGQPAWVTVKTGLFGTKETFVPISQVETQGEDIRVPFDKDTIKAAPSIDVDQHLSPEEEAALYRHYGLGYDDAGDGYTDRGLTDGDNVDTTVGHDTSGPTTDDAMTRSEERLNVGTQQREAGRARLRKHVVTEQQTVNVPVSREEVRLEREPITDANVGDATSGPDISEEEHEVVLNEEVPVVTKETQPVERVRLAKETVTDTETVSDEVRKEQIDTDAPDSNR
jgi:uncharacterized protein (TIGR02271 family)